MTQRAEFEIRSADLCSDFARDMLVRRVGEEYTQRIYAALPVITRGPRKGKVKGKLVWHRVTVGGWAPHVGVLRPGTRLLKIAKAEFAPACDLNLIDMRDDRHYLEQDARDDRIAFIERRLREINL